MSAAPRVPGNYSPMPSVPSYVPSPCGAGLPQPGGPAGPPSLTQGIPDPGAIARQKDVYLKMLDDQLKQGINVLDQQVKYQRDYLTVQCEQQKKQFLLQLDQQMKAQEMVLTQQYNEQLMALQMQAGTQKAALEQQAMQLSMEYEQRKAEEHMYRQQYEIQQQQTEMSVKMARDYQRIVPPSPEASRSPQPSFVPPSLAGPHLGGSYMPQPVGPHLGGSYVPPPGGSCCSGAYQAGCPGAGDFPAPWGPSPTVHNVGAPVPNSVRPVMQQYTSSMPPAYPPPYGASMLVR